VGLLRHNNLGDRFVLVLAVRLGTAGCAAVPIGAVDGTVAAGLPGTPLAVLQRPADSGANPTPTSRDRAANPDTYRVQPGDTLWSLSRRFGTTVEDLLRANGIESPQELRAGNSLHIPERGRASASGDPPGPPPPADKATAQVEKRPKTRSSKRYPFLWPTQGTITSRFGRRGSRQHDGIDIGAAKGSAVCAAADGEVIFAAKQGGYGNLVLLRHRGGLVTVYAHHDRNLVRKGQRVRAGQVIARVGQTGRASGPHLHFEVRRGIEPQNPLRFLPPCQRPRGALALGRAR
jgi:murein DD-endopeptidase MepM/ murein hydrolase activator NlpD